MHVLLVYPKFPATFWSFQHSMALIGRRASFPPLPLITIAAMLPREWRFRLVDLNIERLETWDLEWADVVLVSGMIVQKKSIQEILEACAAVHVPVAVGGPFANNSPDAPELARATSVVVGEAENEAFLAEFTADLEARALKPRYQAGPKTTDIKMSPTPRYDLLRRNAYYSMQMQISRGCPFKCEFCDIWKTLGNKPRMKTRAQIEDELDAIHATGFRGSVFIVDDNFIGNVIKVAEVLTWLVEWQRAHEYPFRFFTEADIRLASYENIMTLMREAGFESVFIGIESPSKDALAETKKTQNLGAKVDVVANARVLREHGILVMGGFILGFDADGPEVFDDMVELVTDAGVYFAMVGLLMALPGTDLETRMRKEGRLVKTSDGDNFQPTNIATKLPEAELIPGFRRVLEELYDPDAYFDRTLTAITQWNIFRTRRAEPYEFLGGMRSVVKQGILSDYRRAYWRFMRNVAKDDPRKLPTAIAMAITAEHMIRYARESAIPALRNYEETLAPTSRTDSAA